MIEVGDMVQVEIGGSLCLPAAAQVLEIVPHGGETYVFIEGSLSGVLIENVVKQ